MLEKTHIKALIVAGEASGDTHAAKLVRELRSSAGGSVLEIFGCAGPKMRDLGVEPVIRADDLAIVGLAEIGRALPIFLRAMRTLRRTAMERQPDVAILVDFPEFNLKLARHLKKQGIKVVYYISPQLWAWRQYRISSIKKHVDLLITILPFEKEWYSKRGVVNVEYVGSPLVKEVHPSSTRAFFCEKHGLDPDRPMVSLLPGSRGNEISRILPVMATTAGTMPDIQFLIATNNSLGGHGRLPSNAVSVVGETYNALNASDAAAVTSGTATLEAAIIGTPLVIVYKTSKLNYSILEPMIDVPHYGLINLIAGEGLAVELIQQDLTPEKLGPEIQRLLDPEVNKQMRVRLKEATDKLGHGGASKRAADLILKLLND